MDEIIISITQAEEQAKSIKEQALTEALNIAEKAEAEAAEIAKNCEAECKVWREKQTAEAEKLGEENYRAALEKSSKDAAAYADGVLKNNNNIVTEIVGRITGGGC